MPQGGYDAAGTGVWRVTGGAFASNGYIGAQQGSSDCFIVDPGLDPERIDAAALSLGLTPRQVFCTHGHFDHIGGAAHFQKKYGAAVHLHPADRKTMKSGNFLLMVLKIPQRIQLPEVTDVEVDAPLDTVSGGALTYRAVPGHTPGSCFIEYGDALFTGDSLYAHGVGLSDLPGEDHEQLRLSLLALWDQIPADRMIYPGHGPAAPFAAIRSGNQPLLNFLAGPPRLRERG